MGDASNSKYLTKMTRLKEPNMPELVSGLGMHGSSSVQDSDRSVNWTCDVCSYCGTLQDI